MAQINFIGQAPYHDVVVDGHAIAIGSLVVDAVQQQQEYTVTINVFYCNGQYSLECAGKYAVQIMIPARRYTDDNTPIPLDINALNITIWNKE